jgi:hypothetical protein
MTSHDILNSELLTLPIINRVLSTTDPSAKPTLYASLLSSKLLVLARGSATNDLDTCTTRLELSMVLASLGRLTEADHELSVLLGCRLMKSVRPGSDVRNDETAREIKVKALRMMEDVNEGLGRMGRARIWREQRTNLESG